jgi:hypothetical protein
VGPRAGLDRCRKSRSNQDSIPGTSNPQPFAIPTELPGPLLKNKRDPKVNKSHPFLAEVKNKSLCAFMARRGKINCFTLRRIESAVIRTG